MGPINVSRGGSSAKTRPLRTIKGWTEPQPRRNIVVDAEALAATRREDAQDAIAAKRAAGKRVVNQEKHKTKKKKPHKVKQGAKTPPDKPKDDNGNPAPGSSSDSSVIDLYKYSWNLPPHKWSMPIEPSEDPMTLNSANYVLGSSHLYRRGRIYWYSRVDTTDFSNSSEVNTGVNGHAKDPRYGFQFLWNPESFNTSVSVNPDITPSFADKFASVVGAFPSGETLSVQLRIDRTNDFASLRSLNPNAKASDGTSLYLQGEDAYEKNLKAHSGYYSDYYAGNGFNSYLKSAGEGESPTSELSGGFADKLGSLQKLGTIADLEYLYKAINGPGWTNAATGKATSDIGFLMPTLLRIDIGPLSYLGYVSSMTVNHIGFTKGMIPIRTDVSLNFNLMATAGLSSK